MISLFFTVTYVSLYERLLLDSILTLRVGEGPGHDNTGPVQNR